MQIVALACETPQASGYRVSHWTPTELATEAIKRGILEKISPRSVGRFLRMKLLYSLIVIVQRLNGNPDDPVQFRQQVTYICQLHHKALELLTQGIHLVSTDEMSGIQALERLHPALPMRPRGLAYLVC